MLLKSDLTQNMRNIVLLRHGEKKVLDFYIKMSKVLIDYFERGTPIRTYAYAEYLRSIEHEDYIKSDWWIKKKIIINRNYKNITFFRIYSYLLFTDAILLSSYTTFVCSCSNSLFIFRIQVLFIGFVAISLCWVGLFWYC